MPNWCNNVVVIGHSDRAKMEQLAKAVREGNFCEYVIPVPESLKITAGRVGDDNDPKQIALEAAEKANIQEHGYAHWYDFCVARWGTKWEVKLFDVDNVEVDDHNQIHLSFDSAWSPPIGIYEALVDDGFNVEAAYYEPGCAFAGKFMNSEDFSVSTESLDRDELREFLGDALYDEWVFPVWEE